MKDFSQVWLDVLKETLEQGSTVSPRGKLTREIMSRNVSVDMRQPVLVVPNRKLSYVFMVAEAFWILSGDDRVSSIAPYNSRIAEFSDDGERFFGAYGPKIKGQLPYVIEKLGADHDTRQAGINIWRENPPATKDVPCTVSMFFSIRENKLMTNVFMRSSDIWLGLPYDVFNFSMISHLVCGLLNERINVVEDFIEPGILNLTAVSSHLYEDNFKAAEACLQDPGDVYCPLQTPFTFWTEPSELMTTLSRLRDLPPGNNLRWWKKVT